MLNLLDLAELVPDSALPWLQLAALLAAVVGLIVAVRWARRRPLEDVLTIVAASIATGVSAQGMWRFTGDVLGLDGPLRLLLFAFVEVAIVTSAVRARRNMRENFSAGVDGIAVWALTVLTAVLSSMDARSLPEAVFRLAAPLVAAWLWERGMAIERHRIRGTGRINWRLTPERILVRLGLAEAKDRTVSEIDAHRRLTRVALAAKRVHQLQEAGTSDRKRRRAVAHRDRMLDQAVAHTGLARDAVAQASLLDMVTTLGGGQDLTDLLDNAAPPWAQLDHPAIPSAAPARTEPAPRTYVFRTAPRTQAPATVRLARTFAFVKAATAAPARTMRRAFTFQPGARTVSVRRAYVFRTPSVRPGQEPADRAAFVREITAEILAAASRSDRWGPDYDALTARTRRSRSWVEKRVREARTALIRTDARPGQAAA